MAHSSASAGGKGHRLMGRSSWATPFPRPVLLNTYDERQEAPLAYNYNLTFEREIFTEWLARLAYVGSASNYGRNTIQLNPARYTPGDTRGVDARRLFAPELGNVTRWINSQPLSFEGLRGQVVSLHFYAFG